jgi:methionine-rich copper-binding protein CopC
MKMRFLFMVLALVFTWAERAQAHAFLDHAEPRVGSTVASPSLVELWMTEDLEPIFSTVQVFDAQGREVDEKDLKIRGATMVVSLPKLEAGTFLVKWKAVATDTHRTSGTFNFTVTGD